MQVFGVDFTSSPRSNKSIACVRAEIVEDLLIAEKPEHWLDFAAFEAALAEPGPWVAALDFPFGQSERFIRNIGWPRAWREYVGLVAGLSREAFCAALEDYKRDRAKGDKEHKRETDIAARSISPQKLYGVPVAKMFFEGAPRVLRSGVSVPGVLDGDPNRIVVEGYPGALARHMIGNRSYKSDVAAKQTCDHLAARREILDMLRNGALLPTHGLRVEADDSISEDPGADGLDALLCAVQAAAAWIRRDESYGAPDGMNPNEGWIAEPTIWRG